MLFPIATHPPYIFATQDGGCFRILSYTSATDNGSDVIV